MVTTCAATTAAESRIGKTAAGGRVRVSIWKAKEMFACDTSVGASWLMAGVLYLQLKCPTGGHADEQMPRPGIDRRCARCSVRLPLNAPGLTHDVDWQVDHYVDHDDPIGGTRGRHPAVTGSAGAEIAANHARQVPPDESECPGRADQRPHHL